MWFRIYRCIKSDLFLQKKFPWNADKTSKNLWQHLRKRIGEIFFHYFQPKQITFALLSAVDTLINKKEDCRLLFSAFLIYILCWRYFFQKLNAIFGHCSLMDSKFNIAINIISITGKLHILLKHGELNQIRFGKNLY